MIVGSVLDDSVVSRSAIELVESGSALQHVVPSLTHQPIISGTADQHIVTVAANSQQAEEALCKARGIQNVIATLQEKEEIIVRVTSNDGQRHSLVKNADSVG